MNTAALSPRRFDGFAVYAVVYLAFLYLPVLFLPLFSFNDSIYIAFPLKGFTTRWYEQMASNSGMGAALANSVRIGASVAVLSTVLGTLAAKAVTRYRMPGRGPVVGFIILPLAVPEIIMGIALVVLAKFGGVGLSLLTIGIGHMILCVPFSMLVMISRLEGFDKHLEEAAADLGEGPWGTFWRVTFPMAMPGVVASLLLTFVISFDEFVLAFFLAGTDATLPVFLWSQLRFPPRLPAVLALGACILVGTIALIVFAEWFRRRGMQSAPDAGVPGRS